jgi:tetratricopeptide (TPR) repeat protein
MYKRHSNIESPDDESIKVWRFIDFAQFVSLLKKRALYFARSDTMPDICEGLYPDGSLMKLRSSYAIARETFPDKTLADKMMSIILSRSIKDKEKFFMNCWYANEFETFAIWDMHLKGERGVCIRSTFEKLTECFSNIEYNVHVGKVEYVDFRTFDIGSLNFESALERLFYKRQGYNYECEIRAVIERDDIIGSGFNVNVPLENLIEEIFVYPNASGWFLDLVQSLSDEYGLCVKVKPSELSDNLLSTSDDPLGLWIHKGLDFSKLGKHKEAIEAYDKALKTRQNSDEVLANKGLELLKLAKHEEALKAFDEALEIKPDYKLWASKGITLSKLDKPREALEACDKALEIKPDSYEVWTAKGVVLSNLDKQEEAIEAYCKALEIKPDSYETWTNKGLALSMLGKHTEALKAHEKALNIKPNNYTILYNCACAYSLMEKKEQAIYNLKRSIELNSSIKERAKIDEDFKELWKYSDFKKLTE